MGAAHRLRIAAGARGEDQHEQVVGLDVGEADRASAVRGEFVCPRGDSTSTRSTPGRRVEGSSASTNWQSAWATSRCQRRAAAGRVQAHGHDPGQGGGDQHGAEERRIAQQHADVRRAARVQPGAQRRRQGGAGRMWSRQLTNEPVGVPRRSSQRRRDRRRRPGASEDPATVGCGCRTCTRLQAGVSASSRPMRSSCPVAPPTANSVCLAARKYRCTGWSVSMPTPPCTWTAVCATRWPASAAQNAAVPTSTSAGRSSDSRHAACVSVSRSALDVDVAVGEPLATRPGSCRSGGRTARARGRTAR